MTLEEQLILMLSNRNLAIFLDIDGTLVDFSDDAKDVRLDRQLVYNLHALFAATQGALAIISGRPIEQIDTLTAPYQFPAAGGHGSHFRLDKTIQQAVCVDPTAIDNLQQQLKTRFAAMDGVSIETKAQGVAVHFRLAPASQAEISLFMHSLMPAYPALTLQPGKAVLEVKPKGVNKGLAIERFMASAPFYNRNAMFIGDDLTDEAGFAAINKINGLSIKVGSGDTKAVYRVENVRAVQELLLKIGHYSGITTQVLEW